MLVPVSDDTAPAAETLGASLLELQAIDTAHDQAVHRRGALVERTRHSSAVEALRSWEQRRVAIRAEIATAESGIEQCEAESAETDVKRQRLEAQLKTVIAPREAEALQHEISSLVEQRSGLDDRELELMDQHADAEARLAELVREEEALRDEVAVADDLLAVAEAAITDQLAELERRRHEVVTVLTGPTLDRYESVRAKLGVAAARLVGSKCEGCHLDLSAGELDEVRRVPADKIPDCPQCGRMLIR